MTDNGRITFIDFIKGLAVIFMMFQHFGIWFWDIPWDKITNIITDYPFYMAVNATGGFSAPAFIACAGFGAYYFNEKYGSNLKFIKRGIILLTFGYIMNFLVPSWFTWASWYVLHLLGFCLIVSPVLLKIKKNYLLILIMTVISLITVYIQYYLKTPLQYSSDRMGDYKMAGGVLRLIFAEGHFPILPWINFFIAGIISADFYHSKKRKNILIFAAASIGTALILLYSGRFFHSLDTEITKFFRIGTSFYPIYPIMLLFLISLVLFSIYILSFINFKNNNLIVLTGRLSLTVFILHIVIFKQGLVLIGKYRIFTTPVSFLLMLFFSFTFVLISYLWSKRNFRFSLEWLMRRLS